MSNELQPFKRKGGLTVVILWTGMSAGILLEIISLFAHQELFVWVAIATLIATAIFGAATKQLFKTRDQEQKTSK